LELSSALELQPPEATLIVHTITPKLSILQLHRKSALATDVLAGFVGPSFPVHEHFARAGKILGTQRATIVDPGADRILAVEILVRSLRDTLWRSEAFLLPGKTTPDHPGKNAGPLRFQF